MQMNYFPWDISFYLFNVKRHKQNTHVLNLCDNNKYWTDSKKYF